MQCAQITPGFAHPFFPSSLDNICCDLRSHLFSKKRGVKITPDFAHAFLPKSSDKVWSDLRGRLVCKAGAQITLDFAHAFFPHSLDKMQCDMLGCPFWKRNARRSHQILPTQLSQIHWTKSGAIYAAVFPEKARRADHTRFAHQFFLPKFIGQNLVVACFYFVMHVLVVFIYEA